MDSLNELAIEIIDKMMDKARELRITVTKSPIGSAIIDCGVNVKGSYEAGRLMTEVCLGGIGKAELQAMRLDKGSFPAIFVSTDSPALACLGSQMIGWEVKEVGYSGFVSGPGRILARKPEKIYEKLGYRERAREAVLVIESSAIPPDPILHSLARMCGVDPKCLYVLVAPTASLAGSAQVAGRCVEAGLHKLERLRFDVMKVLRAEGRAPIAPLIKNERLMMGRLNDMILAAGQAWYTVDGRGIELEKLVERIPSSTSVHYGRPFFEILRDVGFDFFKVDPDIFSVAEVFLIDSETKKAYHAGKIDSKLLRASLALE